MKHCVTTLSTCCFCIRVQKLWYSNILVWLKIDPFGHWYFCILATDRLIQTTILLLFSFSLCFAILNYNFADISFGLSIFLIFLGNIFFSFCSAIKFQFIRKFNIISTQHSHCFSQKITFFLLVLVSFAAFVFISENWIRLIRLTCKILSHVYINIWCWQPDITWKMETKLSVFLCDVFTKGWGRPCRYVSQCQPVVFLLIRLIFMN